MVCTVGDLQTAMALLEYMTEDVAGLRDIEVADPPYAGVRSALE